MAEVVVLVEDIFFQAKMMETARHVGIMLNACSNGDALIAAVERERPKLIIVDLNARNGALDAIQKLHASDNQAPVIGYLSHVQTELADRARAAGCRYVMPRSKFTAELASILASAKS